MSNRGRYMMGVWMLAVIILIMVTIIITTANICWVFYSVPGTVLSAYLINISRFDFPVSWIMLALLFLLIFRWSCVSEQSAQGHKYCKLQRQDLNLCSLGLRQWKTKTSLLKIIQEKTRKKSNKTKKLRTPEIAAENFGAKTLRLPKFRS